MARLSKLNRSVAGKVALITGAGSGMGRATACLFADEGAKVAAVDWNAEPVEKVAEEIRGAGNTARAWQCDVSDRQADQQVASDGKD